MIDLYLDPITHDVVVKDFTLDVTRSEADLITQKLKIKLLWFKGEWFQDESYGIPYFQEVFVKGVNLEDIDDVFRAAIANEDGVVDLISYSSSINESTRELTVNAKIKIRNGEIVSIVFSV